MLWTVAPASAHVTVSSANATQGGYAKTITAGHAFVQNLRRGHHELGIDAPPALRVAAAFTGLAQAI